MTEILGHDLFGDPVVARRAGPGRPEVVWNSDTSTRVLLAFARGLSVKVTAEIVGLSSPTLRKVYFSECGKRAKAALLMEQHQLGRLNEQAAKGNVAAEKELWVRLEKLRTRDQHRADAPAPTAKAVKLGKKEAAETAARAQTGLYEPPPAPLLN